MPPACFSRTLLLASLVPLLAACGSGSGASGSAPTGPEAGSPDGAGSDAAGATDAQPSGTESADVVEVSVTGTTFLVTLRSPDKGCDQYANWWEVLRPDGSLVHRRILGHSHVDEQPFARSSSPVDVSPDEPLLVRAHMHPQGYGGVAMKGTVSGGFAVTTLAANFAAQVETQAPLAGSCAF